MNRLVPLDSLRGIAVLLVIIHHWLPGAEVFGLGNIGVQLFFVLSGFLITGILLTDRVTLAQERATLTPLLQQFWLRRITRIWPVMYLTIAFAFTIGARYFDEDPSTILWHIGSLSNVLFMLKGQFDGYFSHYWSLAVEQQFYVVWPFLVLLTRGKILAAVIVAGILAAPATRLTLVALGADDFAEYNTLVISNLDSLGMGALVAMLCSPNTNLDVVCRRLGTAAVISAVAILADQIWLALPGNLEQTFFAIIFGWVVLAVYARKLPSLVQLALTFPPLVYVGTISYGLYVYHVFFPRLVGLASSAVGHPLSSENNAAVYFLFCALTLLVFASGSWFFVERPLLRFGKTMLGNSSALQKSAPEFRPRLKTAERRRNSNDE